MTDGRQLMPIARPLLKYGQLTKTAVSWNLLNTNEKYIRLCLSVLLCNLTNKYIN